MAPRPDLRSTNPAFARQDLAHSEFQELSHLELR